MKTKILQLIEDSDMNPMQKNVARGTLERSYQAEELRQALVSEMMDAMYQKGKGHYIDSFFRFDKYIIAHVIKHGDKKSTFDDVWRTYDPQTKDWMPTCSQSDEQQVLVTLATKYIGQNTDYVYLNCKMLGIKIDE